MHQIKPWHWIVLGYREVNCSYQTLAEGIEEACLASQPRFMGGDEAQGYRYAPLLAVEDLERWFRERGAS